jgi:hypothetical protein
MKVNASFDIVSEYMKLKYPTAIVAAIYTDVADENGWPWIEKFLAKNPVPEDQIPSEDTTYDDLELLFVEFDTEAEAVAFCNSVPNSAPYCTVYVNGEAVHENS